MQYKVILTDLDGVIRHFPSQRDGSIETSLGLPKGIIAQTAFEKDLLQKVITGKISDEAWRSEVRAKLSQMFGSALAEQAESRWSESAGEVDQGVLRFLTGFKPGVSLALLTNATSRLRQDLSRLGIWEEFEEVFNSSEIGHAKPSREVFVYAMKSLDCQSSEILFIDDSFSNVSAARDLGFHAIHFKNLTDFKESLEKEKVG